jgi:hypothetical protein
VPTLALVLVVATVLLAGRGVARVVVGAEDGRAFRLALELTAGVLVLHLVLAWLDLAGVPWQPFLVGALAAAVALAGHRWAGVAPPPARPVGPRLGWAALGGAAVVALFALLAVSQRISFPDFVYHWGIKGHRYFLQRGIDYDFLAAEWNLVAHRDYPQLVPELYALQSIVAGRFSEPALLAWSALGFGGLLIAVSEALRATALREPVARIAFLVVALAVGAFAVGHLMAGSADWIVAFALAAALPALHRPPSVGGELQLGVLAALAASSKLEGIPLALLLFGAGLWRRLRHAPDARSIGSLAGAVSRLAGPSLLAVTPWLVQGLRHDLFRDPQSGPLELERAPAIAAAVWRTMLQPEWHLAPLALLLVPLLYLRPETRLIGAVVTLLVAGYLLRYFTAAFDFEFSVLSSFPRLIFHVFPAVVVGLAVLADRWTPAVTARRRIERGASPS